MPTSIFLVPGFFGFANLGKLRYFEHVENMLSLELQKPVFTVPTRPTASLAQRATRLAEVIAENSQPGDEVHIVGHSSGGLDARLLATPNNNLPDVDPELSNRIRSVLTVATPHRGTPSARFFTTVLGRQMLKLLSIATVYIVRNGSLPRDALVALVGVYTKFERGTFGEPEMLETLYADLLGSFDAERQVEVRAFFEDVTDDRGLLAQITPDAMDAFNAATPDHEDVRYGSIITRASRPAVLDTLTTLSPYDRSAKTLFAACWAIGATNSNNTSFPVTDEQMARLLQLYESPPSEQSNDAMVPTLSQPWGEVVDAARADHLDIIGHLSAPDDVPPHYDWLPSGSGYRRERFIETWRAAARFIEGA